MGCDKSLSYAQDKDSKPLTSSFDKEVELNSLFTNTPFRRGCLLPWMVRYHQCVQGRITRKSGTYVRYGTQGPNTNLCGGLRYLPAQGRNSSERKC